MTHSVKIAVAAAWACCFARTATGGPAENLAPLGEPMLGVASSFSSSGVTVAHLGPVDEINDGVFSLNLAPDGFQINADGHSGANGNGADTFAGGGASGAFDFVGVRFAEPQYGVTSVRVQNFLANDGGWWGPTTSVAGGSPLAASDLSPPQVQVTRDGGATWSVAAATSDYVSQYVGVVRGSGFPNATAGPWATFTFAPQNGIDAIRLIGNGAGSADGNGFIGVCEFEAHGVPQELSLRVTLATGLVEIVNAMQSSISFDYYEIASAGGALNLAAWNGFAAPGGNPPGFPSGGGAGTGWETLGDGSGQLAAEAFLLGASSLAPGERAALGYLFGGDVQDVTFQYRTPGGRVVAADVSYVAGVAGDFDGNGAVDGTDLLVWQREVGSALAAADLADWRANYGRRAAPGVVMAPEPAAFAPAALTIAWASVEWARRGNARRSLGRQVADCSGFFC
ncbi:MAG: hypothetical protein DCC67_06455 [Planctomycetota bacterium]|nr:MAG: hypothetical protein DCC67_06455 [Planctomycetota bacterium]